MQELGRFRVLDEKPVNLDGFSVADADLGLVAMHSPHDPIPSLVIDNGVVTELDGKSAADFDVIDEFIARYGIDLAVADEAMALDDAVLAPAPLCSGTMITINKVPFLRQTVG